MAISSFPNGFAEGVLIRGVPLLQAYPGKVFWVGNSATLLQGEAGASNSNKGTFLSPWSTLDFAIGQCAANRGDIIVVRPGHVTTCIAAGTVTLDVAGVAIIGIGAGANRPTVNFTTATTASFLVTGANCTVMNMLFTGGINALVNPIHIQAADFALLNCEYRETSTFEAVDTILTTAAATRLLIDGYVHRGSAAAGANSAIALVGCVGPVIKNFKFDLNAAVAIIDLRTTLSSDISISNGVMRQRHATGLLISDTITGSLGTIGPNIFGKIVSSGTGAIAASVLSATVDMVIAPVIVANSDAANVYGLALVRSTASDA